MTRRLLGIAGLVAALAGPLAGSGQTPAQTAQTPTFQSQVTYVEVDVIVTDNQGRFVRDLKKEDFQITEDGRKQNVDEFALVDIPIDTPDQLSSPALTVEPDVKTNAVPFEGRVFVLALDTAHTEFANTPRLRAAARDFVEHHLGARDLTAVVHVGGKQEAAQDFTSNKRLLLASIDQFEGRKLTSAAIVKQQADEAGTVTAPNGQAIRLFKDYDLENERGGEALTMLRQLRAVADWFGGVRGRRKAIVLLSEGVDYDIAQVFSQKAASPIIEGAREAVAAVTRANVSIYALDPSRLKPISEQDIERFSPRSSAGAPGTSDSDRPPGGDGLQNEQRLANNSLRYLAENTGGFALVNSNNVSAGFDRVVAENSAYYVLAYYPNSGKKDTAFHNIKVQVSRSGVVVNARHGYATASGTTAASPATLSPSGLSRELLDVIRSPMPTSGLTLGLFAAPFKGTSSNASVLLGVELRGRDLKLSQNESVELAYAAIDNAPKIRASQTINFKLNLQPETLAKAEQTGVRLLRRFELAPGRYQLRVAAREAVDGLTGSVVYDLEVPDFAKEPLAMSGLVMTSPSGSRQPTLMRDDRLKDALPGPPVALRSFPQAEEVAFYVEIYDNQAGPHTVDILTTIATPDGTVVFDAQETRSSGDLEADRTYRYSSRVTFGDIDPGTYVLKIVAHSRLGADVTVSRQVPFTVVARSQ